MEDFSLYVRSDRSDLQLDQILQEPTDVLLGVTGEAAEILSRIGIATVFDLGSSWLFANAQAAAEAGEFGTASQRLGTAPSDWLDPSVSVDELDDIGSLPIEALRGLPDAEAVELRDALAVSNIRDFAYWPPRRTAVSLLSRAMGSTTDIEEQAAEELRPRLGEYPTERVYYNTLVMLQTVGDEDLQPLVKPISLQPAIDQPTGFGVPAVGALLTYSQSWFAKGVTLGHMLHSLALAPGEATRIAVIDWSRRTSASVAEAIAESERLDNSTEHARAISEVQNAVADEMQTGGSISSGWARSTSEARARTGSSGLLGSLLSSQSGSVSTQEATSASQAESSSWSVGSRSIMASMTQNINDRTEQHATAVRNRRASAVREVAQSEHEEVSTRIVANYNHMHALTVQYYEVVQIYRVLTQMHRAERCLFVPFEQLDFAAENGSDLVDRFRGALVRSALSARVRDLLIDEGATVAITAVSKVPRPRFAIDTGVMELAPEMLAVETDPPASSDDDGQGEPQGPARRAFGVWSLTEIERAAHVVRRPLTRPDSDSIYLPDETELLAISFSGVNLAAVRLDGPETVPGEVGIVANVEVGQATFSNRIPIHQIDAVSVTRAAEDSLHAGGMTLHCSYRGRRFNCPTIPLQLESGTAMQKVAAFTSDETDRKKELLAHLRANQTYYSQAVLLSLDSATLVMLLSGFSWRGKSLAEQIEPKPLTVAGNYLILRAPVDPEDPSDVIVDGENLSWAELLEQRNIDSETSDSRLTPIPTAGVFAEAVLGRSNSAERLDITRFWNWQDSPIPLQPTEIAPVQTGSRREAETLTPGTLSSPLLNIVNPTSLPDPSGLGASLNALTAANLFRDMSGLQGTQSLAEEGLTESLAAASQAGEIASANLKTEAEKAVAMGQIGADIAKAAITGVPPTGSTKGISADGARINHGRDLDRRGKTGNQKAPTPSGSNVGDGGEEDLLALGGESDDTFAQADTELFGEFSREGAYADRSAFGFSPDAVNAVTPSISEFRPIFAAGGGGSGSSSLGVTRRQMTAFDRILDDSKASRRRFKQLVIGAANKVGLNPGLLAVNLIRETLYVDYLRNEKTSSFLVGTDDYFDKRNQLAAKVPEESDVNWDRTQTPTTDSNETGRQVNSILFDSGPDALLASAVYLKHGEVVLRETAADLSANFDAFNADLRFALTRLAFNAGLGRAKRNMTEFIDQGTSVLIRTPQKKAGPQRKATIAAAQAIHISNTIFGIVP